MDEIHQARIGGFNPASSDSSEPPRTVTRLLLLWPLAGVIALGAAMIAYSPLDDRLLWWVGAAPCVVSYILINIAWRKAKAGGGVPSFLPATSWLALGCLFVPLVLFVNGALDRSPSNSIAKSLPKIFSNAEGKVVLPYYPNLHREAPC